jgi:hypothetical protein
MMSMITLHHRLCVMCRLPVIEHIEVTRDISVQSLRCSTDCLAYDENYWRGGTRVRDGGNSGTKVGERRKIGRGEDWVIDEEKGEVGEKRQKRQRKKPIKILLHI